MFLWFKNNTQFLSWVQAFIATVASLYLSEIEHFIPCKLCWYQRICMYPLVVIIFIGIIKKDIKLYLYVLPISLIGFFISIYHNLLYYGLLPNSTYSCIIGESCTTRYIDIAGVFSIPLLSLLAFSVIITLQLLFISYQFPTEKK